MFEFKFIYDTSGNISHIETRLKGYELLNTPKLNKGCAFSNEERELFGLNGLLPHQVETMEQHNDGSS